jgi:hypothetical protein
MDFVSIRLPRPSISMCREHCNFSRKPLQNVSTSVNSPRLDSPAHSSCPGKSEHILSPHFQHNPNGKQHAIMGGRVSIRLCTQFWFKIHLQCVALVKKISSPKNSERRTFSFYICFAGHERTFFACELILLSSDHAVGQTNNALWALIVAVPSFKMQSPFD